MKNTLCKITENFNIPQSFRGLISQNMKLSSHTSFQIGGITPFFLEPSSADDLLLLLNAFSVQKIPFFILGGGSNLVIADEGIPVPVVSTKSLCALDMMNQNDGTILLSCGSGVTIENLTSFCTHNALEGLENFAGLPGTAGGAVYMNARCYEKSISEILESANYFAFDGTVYKELQYDYCDKDWSYKKSPFQGKNSIVTNIFFRLKTGEKDKIAEKCAYFLNDRKEKGHFKYPSAGSVFKNNHAFGKPSGKIIDEAGLKGLKIGGAQIAPWHGNFIINTGNAKAAEVKELVTIVQKNVLEKFGFNLEPEIIFSQDLF